MEQGAAQRLAVLRYLINGDNQTAFAARLGISVARWNNFERGSPLSKEIAFLLVKKVPGLTLDWLYFGKVDGVPMALRNDLERAAAELPRR